MSHFRVLAIDTATEVCSVAVLTDDGLTEQIETVGNKHSDRVLPMIDSVLKSANLTLQEVDTIAFGAGPGSFTGLRIACGVAQGLAYGARKLVVPIGNLRALAARALSVDGGDRVLAAIDARVNEAYCAIYRRDDAISEVTAPALVAPQSLAQLAADEGVDIVAGNALAVYSGVWPHPHAWVALPDVTPTAADIARLGHHDARHGKAVTPDQAAPLYVRDRVALTIEQRQQARAIA